MWWKSSFRCLLHESVFIKNVSSSLVQDALALLQDAQGHYNGGNRGSGLLKTKSRINQNLFDVCWRPSSSHGVQKTVRSPFSVARSAKKPTRQMADDRKCPVHISSKSPSSLTWHIMRTRKGSFIREVDAVIFLQAETLARLCGNHRSGLDKTSIYLCLRSGQQFFDWLSQGLSTTWEDNRCG